MPSSITKDNIKFMFYDNKIKITTNSTNSRLISYDLECSGTICFPVDLETDYTGLYHFSLSPWVVVNLFEVTMLRFNYHVNAI